MKVELPIADRGYASPFVGFGKAYADAVSKAAEETAGSMPTLLVDPKNQSREDEVDIVNHRFQIMRKIVDRELVRYLEENDGKIDAWPDPDSQFSTSFQPEEKNEDLLLPIQYRFHYFGEEFDKSGHRKSSQPKYFNAYEPVYRDHVQLIESSTKRGGSEFLQNNPLLCLWELFKRIIIAIFPVVGVLCAAYLAAVNFFGLDPAWLETVIAPLESGAEAYSGLPEIIEVLLSAVLMVLVGIPMLLYSITQLVYQLSGGSLVVNIIAMVLIPVLCCVPAYYLYAIFARNLRHVNLFRGIKGLGEFISLGLYQLTPLYRSKKRREMAERQIHIDAVDAWHRAWYSYVCSHDIHIT